ncbi:hypothetical protein BLNAU_24602 [Blattamonas nauphoetae]|uniref:Uncharacterized protein n=1 Tax=Blattamonas nauphoetae TaxID=2049346 RepID=A0ABQ9WMB0_9EUKA|nr:hypothetical protein BLNAU_24602 [Blattamonas nauphoetae]
MSTKVMDIHSQLETAEMDILELPDCLSRRLALPTAAQITSQPCSMMGGGPDQEQNDCESQPQPHQYDEWKHPIQIQSSASTPPIQ